MRQKHKFWAENCTEVLYEIKDIYFQIWNRRLIKTYLFPISHICQNSLCSHEGFMHLKERSFHEQ
jgi:hypothetical protein